MYIWISLLHIYLTVNLVSPVSVIRREHDMIKPEGEFHDCFWDISGSSMNTTCICDTSYGFTFMSGVRKTYQCSKQSALECSVQLVKNNVLFYKTYLVERDVNITVLNRISPKCQNIKDIHIWNTNGTLGRWVRLPYPMLRFFKLNKHLNDYTISILNLDVTIWMGHVIKLTFGSCNACAVMKVIGQITYPFDENKFIGKVIRPRTVTRPTTTTEVPSSITVFRNESDDVRGVKDCSHIGGRPNDHSGCTCANYYTTFMSNDGETGVCLPQFKIGCHVYLTESLVDTYLVKEDINIPIRHGMPPKCLNVKEIHIWNMNNTIGKWIELPGVVCNNFKLNTSRQPNALIISNLEMETWAGHVVKVIYGGCNKCSIIKMQGEIRYPFDVRKIISKLPTTTSTSTATGTAVVTKRQSSTTRTNASVTTARGILTTTRRTASLKTSEAATTKRTTRTEGVATTATTRQSAVTTAVTSPHTTERRLISISTTKTTGVATPLITKLWLITIIIISIAVFTIVMVTIAITSKIEMTRNKEKSVQDSNEWMEHNIYEECKISPNRRTTITDNTCDYEDHAYATLTSFQRRLRAITDTAGMPEIYSDDSNTGTNEFFVPRSFSAGTIRNKKSNCDVVYDTVAPAQWNKKGPETESDVYDRVAPPSAGMTNMEDRMHYYWEVHRPESGGETSIFEYVGSISADTAAEKEHVNYYWELHANESI